MLSATPTSTNQNIWIEEMKKVLPQYPSVQLVTVAYGDDLSDKSYREAVGLLKSYPDLKVIVSPSSVGIVAAAQAVKDQWQNRQSVCHRAGAAVGNGRRDQVRRQQKLRHLEPD